MSPLMTVASAASPVMLWACWFSGERWLRWCGGARALIWGWGLMSSQGFRYGAEEVVAA